MWNYGWRRWTIFFLGFPFYKAICAAYSQDIIWHRMKSGQNNMLFNTVSWFHIYFRIQQLPEFLLYVVSKMQSSCLPVDTLKLKEVPKLPFSMLFMAEPRLELRMGPAARELFIWWSCPMGEWNNGNFHHYAAMHLSAHLLWLVFVAFIL